MSDSILASYEAVPYDSKPITFADVATLETVARLHGLRPQPTDDCQVLELGCASGGHVISMAHQFPRSRFVGIDLAPNQIEQGRQMIADLGLSNVSLEAMSIAAIGDDFGVFDYVIAHGVYSWVPPEVQDAILRVCSRNLAPNGIAYVSYNAYPGWHARGMVRDMILFHDDPGLAPADRVARARTFVSALVAAQTNASSAHAMALADEERLLNTQDDSHFLHEQLEPFNSPVYFAEFARRASLEGLRYVGETKLGSNARHLPGQLRTLGIDEADVIRTQQYLDFSTGRAFRRSLLCHAGADVLPEPSASALTKLHLTMRALPDAPSPEDAARGGDVQSFRAPDGTKITTNNPLVLAALRALLRVAPATLSFAELLTRVNARLDADATPGLEQDTPDRTEDLAGAMLQCAVAGFVGVHSHASTFAARVTERPTASVIARYRAQQSALVPNLRYGSVELTSFERFLLMHLNGSNTPADLLALTENAVAEGAITPAPVGVQRSDWAAAIDSALARFATVALLET